MMRNIRETPSARILRSRAFRRLAGKTQVLHAPPDGISTRLTHTLEVASLATTLASSLPVPAIVGSLDLARVEAIALAHDVGHPPFGHVGERILARLASDAGLGGFHHAAFGVRLLSLLEHDPDDGAPIVDDPFVLRGMLAHSKGKSGAVFRSPNVRHSIESLVVRAADLYAYATQDLDDARHLGVLDPRDLPPIVHRVLGRTPSAIRCALLDRTVAAVSASPEAGIHLDTEAAEALESLRATLYERVYEGPLTAPQNRLAETTLGRIFRHAIASPRAFLASVGDRSCASEREVPGDGTPALRRSILDAIACMTDRRALEHAAPLVPLAAIA